MSRKKPLAFGPWPLAFSLQRSAIRMGVFLAALLLLAGVALAGSVAYEVPWFTVDGGGGESAGGGYALAGTAGQSDAGALSGGAFTLVGGFWPGVEALSFRYLPVIMRR